MKFVVRIALVAIVVVCFSCQEAKEGTQKIPRSLNPDIGQPISMETANRWSARYMKRNGDMRTQQYRIDELNLEMLLALSSDPIGLAFHYGTDDHGDEHILVTSVNQQNELWSLNVALDANSAMMISGNVAEEMALRFRNENPDAIWYHFFGSRTFDEIQSLRNFSHLEIQKALNDQDEPQLLLYVYNTNDEGRVSSEAALVYDMSYPCPPCNTN